MRIPIGGSTLAVLISISVGWAAASAGAEGPAYRQRLTLPGAQDTIGFPSAVTADNHADEVFVCDRNMNRILIYDSQGAFTYEIQGGELFRAPQDLAVDPEGFLFVVANHENRPSLLELDFDGLFIRRIELAPIPDDLGEPRPTSVALSADGGRLYVVDGFNMWLWIADRSGKIEKGIDLVEDYSGDDRRKVMLGHVDVYGDRVLMPNASRGEIGVFSLAGSRMGTVGIKGGAPCKLGRPQAAALDAEGDMWLIDQQKMVISQWQSESNRCLAEFWGIGMAPGFLYYPVDVALDKSGRLYVAQGYEGRVQMYEGLPPAASD